MEHVSVPERDPTQEANVRDREVIVLMVQRETADSWSGQRLDSAGPGLTGPDRESIERQIHETWVAPDLATAR